MVLPGNLSCRICDSEEHLARNCAKRPPPAASSSAGTSGNIFNFYIMGDKPSSAAVAAAKELAGAAMPQKNDRVVGFDPIAKLFR